jgi:uncharacterized membrane protein
MPMPVDPRPSSSRELANLKDHVVQIESLQVYTFIFLAVMFVVQHVPPFSDNLFLLLLITSAFLVGLRLVIRVTNPASSVRNRLTWAAILGGAVGAVCGAAADIATGGLTAGQGTVLGWGVGAGAGAALGDRLENLGKSVMMERGDAFNYLYGYRRRNPRLANPTLVNEALDNKITAYDINQDGRRWYSKEDLENLARGKGA